MPDSVIKAEEFATSKVKKKIATITPKPRTALLQGGGNDVATSCQVTSSESFSNNPNIAGSTRENCLSVSASINAASNGEKPCNARDIDVAVNCPVIVSINNFKDSETVTSKILNEYVETKKEDARSIYNLAKASYKGEENVTVKSLDIRPVNSDKIGSVPVAIKSHKKIINATMHCQTSIKDPSMLKKENAESMSKPRTALFQGGEDDEPITPHIISTPNYCVISTGTEQNLLLLVYHQI